MSNVGQAALIVVGTVVGAYFGAPQLGFVLGSLAGNALFPTQLPGQSGPRMSDGQTTSSIVGTPVPILFGTASLSGCYMWLAPIVETTNTENVGGKGGPTQTNTTYTYTQSVAVGLCEGPIGGITRIWENGMLVYDIRAQRPLETDTDFANRLTVAATYAETFTLHLGDEDQVADATIEAIEGMGNVPGFRGLAYLVYANRKLREDQALRHPSFKFECFETGSVDCTHTTEYSVERYEPWVTGDDPRNIAGAYGYAYVSFGNVQSAAHPTLAEAFADAISVDAYTPLGHLLASGRNFKNTGAAGTSSRGYVFNPNATAVALFYNSQEVNSQVYTSFTGVGDACPAVAGWVSTGLSKTWWNGDIAGGAVGSYGPHGVWTLIAGTGRGYFNCGDNSAAPTPDCTIAVIRSSQPPLDPCALLPTAPLTGYCIREDGKYIKGGAWTLITASTFKVLAKYATNSGSGLSNEVIQLPLNPCLPTTDPNYSDSAFWTAAYNAAVLAGTMPPGQVYGTDYPQAVGSAYTIDYQVCDSTAGSVTLGHIIRAICLRCGLTDIDVADMDAVTVNGYAISSVSAGRDILTPLRSVGFFDCVESGPTLKFVARGKPIVATLTSDNFGAYDGGANPTPGPAITTVKAQDADLPLQTRVHYFATSRDYEAGEQLSPTRLTTTAVNVVDVELAVCMDDTQAAKIADVLWADAWAERWAGTLAVDQAKSELEPGDCIEVPVDGVTRRIRIVNETVASGVLRTLNYVRDDDGAYVSHAVAAAPIRQPQKLKLLSATDLELLDLPPLTDAANDAGIYAAASGSSLAGNAWNGCVIFRSADGGATFAQLGSITTASAIGTLASAVAPSDWHAWDDVTTIIVNVAVGVTFESRTDAAVLTGANSAAMGADGRWEIVQFANATQLSPTQWRLSRLLRGRRGTEHSIDSSAIGDKFVMISTGGLVRLPLQTSEIGAARIYKAVTIGASYSSGIDQTFAGQGVALKPFSPVLLTGERDTAGDIVLHWTRRGRLGRTLMSGVDIPLSEAVESYSIDIYAPDSPHTIVRTIAASTPTATYTAAQQSTDFGSDSAGHLLLAVYQISATVGRGYPDFQLLTIG